MERLQRPALLNRRWERGRCHRPLLAGLAAVLLASASVRAAELPAAARFRQQVLPVLSEYCFDCHGDGMNKGGVTFDEFASDQAMLADHELWWNVLKYLRAGIMPPERKPRPDPAQRHRLEQWIKTAVFAFDPKHPDPGRPVLRRLNRIEYRNTIRDLLDVDYDTENEFPPDDTGYGFDNIGAVLTVSPLLLEKYLAAAETIVKQAKPALAKRFLAKPIPQNAAERHAYAAQVLGDFTTLAFRRPVDAPTVERLVKLAEQAGGQPGADFASGLSRAMAAALASPRFLFLEERLEAAPPDVPNALVDEYSLASRLSYFLWSSMPDAELFQLAAAHQLRAHLAAQVQRMLADPRAQALVRNFTGQWLQTRDVDSVPIEARIVLAHDAPPDPEREQRRARFRELRNRPEESLSPAEKQELAKIREVFFGLSRAGGIELTHDLRRDLRHEAEAYFGYVLREDRSVTEFLDSDYAFLNERLARHYGLTNLDVSGDQLRRVTLPPDSHRGGVLTLGSVLAVTSNPTRTSPVKRGRFILDNLLGLPSPPPPPNIPPLEDAAHPVGDREPTLRETLARHRAQPLCSSCHDRLDPPGLALENFNALGMWREQEHGQPVDATGKLITGETFTNVCDLKRILLRDHRPEFYRCLTEKLLTYALGRGLDYQDVGTVDQIVARLEQANGRFSVLMTGIIESAPFQKRRISAMLSNAEAKTSSARAEVN